MVPSISVIIPVKNNISTIENCIKGILSQSVCVEEIVVIDSGSTDGTIEILNKYDKVKLIQIPPEQFNHGSTRNIGVNNAIGEFCVLTVADARPADENWIKEMLNCFDDTSIAGVCGQQIVPHEKDKNPVQWFRPISQPEIKKYKFNKDDFNQLTPEEKRSVCGWDDVTAMYRTHALRQIPFQHTTFAEDALWAKDALLAGYTIVYNPTAKVYHYHHEDADFTFKRSFTVFYHFYKFFGYKPSQINFSILRNLRLVKTIFTESEISWEEKLKWWRYNVQLHKATIKAVKVFNNTLAIGQKKLDYMHEQLCNKPPTPTKN